MEKLELTQNSDPPGLENLRLNLFGQDAGFGPAVSVFGLHLPTLTTCCNEHYEKFMKIVQYNIGN